MTLKIGESFTAKARWHDEQRRLSPKEKIAILLDLQEREATADRIRRTLGRPAFSIKRWATRP